MNTYQKGEKEINKREQIKRIGVINDSWIIDNTNLYTYGWINESIPNTQMQMYF